MPFLISPFLRNDRSHAEWKHAPPPRRHPPPPPPPPVINVPPVADIGGPYASEMGIPISFDGSGSHDPDGTIVSYAWTFGDGGTSALASPSHTFATNGTFLVTLTVTDNLGATDSDTANVPIATPVPPLPPIADAGGPYTGETNQPVSLDGSGSTGTDGTIISYAWTFGDGGTGTGVSPSHAYTIAGVYTATLTVTDDLGGIDSDTTTVTITDPPPPPEKGYPKGLVDLTAALDGPRRIDNSLPGWTNPLIDGMRIRIGWKDLELSDGVIDWSKLDECFAMAENYNRWLGVGVIAGDSCPQWLFDDAGAAFRVLAEDGGIEVVPWDPVFLNRWFRFVDAFGARYDNHPLLRYVPMGGVGRHGESYIAQEGTDVTFFNDNAIASGYVGTAQKYACSVAWEDSSRQIANRYNTAFPKTPFFLTQAVPFPTYAGGGISRLDYIAWGVVTHPARFGLMNSQLNCISNTTTPNFETIFNNYLTNPTGIQFLWRCADICGACRMSRCDGTTLGCVDYGNSPCLAPDVALDTALSNCVDIKARFAEMYEVDIKQASFQGIMATRRAQLIAINP